MCWCVILYLTEKWSWPRGDPKVNLLKAGIKISCMVSQKTLNCIYVMFNLLVMIIWTKWKTLDFILGIWKMDAWSFLQGFPGKQDWNPRHIVAKFFKTFILIFSSNKSLLSESNHRDVTIVLTKEDQEELGFFGPLKKIIGWSCRNNQFTGDSCNRQLMSGSHILSLVSKHK